MVTNLQSWNIKENDFPKDADDNTKVEFMLHYAVLAPSSWNSQPWKFKLSDASVKLYLDPERRQPQRDPLERENTISCGAALCNLQLAMHRYGFSEETVILPDPEDENLLAEVKWQNIKTLGKDNKLFKAIQQRHSFRKPFKTTVVPNNIVNTLVNAANIYGCDFIPVTNDSLRIALAGMVSEGDKDLGSEKALRQEYASWMRSSGRKGDGVPGYAMDLSALEGILSPLTHRFFDYTDEFANEDHSLAAAATLVGIICSPEDTKKWWVASGQAIERVLLSAAANGIQASFLNQPIPVPELRARLQSLLHIESWPQLIVRLGYPTELNIAPTPRRKLSEVIM